MHFRCKPPSGQVDGIRANYSGTMVSLTDICLKPLGEDCATQSVLQVCCLFWTLHYPWGRSCMSWHVKSSKCSMLYFIWRCCWFSVSFDFLTTMAQVIDASILSKIKPEKMVNMFKELYICIIWIYLFIHISSLTSMIYVFDSISKWIRKIMMLMVVYNMQSIVLRYFSWLIDSYTSGYIVFPFFC